MQHAPATPDKTRHPVPAPQRRAMEGPGQALAQRAAASPATARLAALQRKADGAATGTMNMAPSIRLTLPQGPILQGAFDVAYQGFGTARSKDNRAIPGVHMWHPKWTEEQSEFPNPKDNPAFDTAAYADKGKNARRTYNRLMRGASRTVTIALWSVKARSQKGKNHIAYLQDRTPGNEYTYYDNRMNNPTQDDHIKGQMNATDQARFDQWDAAR